jgi:hypothetical protein
MQKHRLYIGGFQVMILFIIVMGSVSVALWFTFTFCEWKEVTDKTEPRIKFKTFLRFYKLNPKRWRLRQYGVSCKMELSDPVGKCVSFSFIDFLRYRRWYHKNEANEDKKQADQALADIIAAVKQDIKANEPKEM